mmetsp:Transcript_58061/g.127248  ORF Transcript_58061/g.127248 Transcript_58061/m.127248 type:complete len:266 (-) Transcript_58061:5-802(-)
MMRVPTSTAPSLFSRCAGTTSVLLAWGVCSSPISLAMHRSQSASVKVAPSRMPKVSRAPQVDTASVCCLAWRSSSFGSNWQYVLAWSGLDLRGTGSEQDHPSNSGATKVSVVLDWRVHLNLTSSASILDIFSFVQDVQGCGQLCSTSSGLGSAASSISWAAIRVWAPRSSAHFSMRARAFSTRTRLVVSMILVAATWNLLINPSTRAPVVESGPNKESGAHFLLSAASMMVASRVPYMVNFNFWTTVNFSNGHAPDASHTEDICL